MKNKTFEKMTAAEKRVAIAQDAVKQIEAKKYKIGHGGYLEMANRLQHVNQKTLKASTCACCAAGAMLASAVRINNNFDCFWITSSETMQALKGYFNPDQLALIEVAFERDVCGLSLQAAQCGAPTKPLDVEAAMAFGERYKFAKSRSLAIFRNIIANKGEFKP